MSIRSNAANPSPTPTRLSLCGWPPTPTERIWTAPRVRLSDFDFDLPDERIALRPARPRDRARLLHVTPAGKETFHDKSVSDLTGLLEPGDGLVFNDTRVIAAGLSGVREREGVRANISFNLHRRVDASHWRAFARPAKRPAPGDRISFGADNSACGAAELWATVAERGADGEVTLAFDLTGPALDEAIEAMGEMPLPPYIVGKRPPDAADQTDYQTIFAKHAGAVAAPTAGLHFTEELLAALEARGVSSHFVTLHVGAGTFLPVKADDPAKHSMLSEWGEVADETAEGAHAAAPSRRQARRGRHNSLAFDRERGR